MAVANRATRSLEMGMRMIRLAAIIVAGLVLAQGSARADGATADEVVAFVDKMVAHIKEVGETQAFADFSDTKGAWVKGDLYGFCHALDGTSLAHGGNPNLVGKNLLSFKDPDGVAMNAQLIDLVKKDGKGWVDYKWPNPATKKVQAKSVYGEMVDGKFLCGSGYYK